jgi:tetratricopeptide (TPR) repeat protein
VGRYLYQNPDLHLETFGSTLESHRLRGNFFQKEAIDFNMTAETVISEIFQFGWNALSEEAWELAYFLSLFGTEPIDWSLVEDCIENSRETRNNYLLRFHFINRRGQGIYQLHQLIREFIQVQDLEDSIKYSCQQKFCRVIAAAAKEIPTPEVMTIQHLQDYMPVIPLMANIAKNFPAALSNEETVFTFRGLGRFYSAQGKFGDAEYFYRNGIKIARLKNAHLDSISFSRMEGEYALILFELKKFEESERHFCNSIDFFEEFDELVASADYADILDGYAILLQHLQRFEEAESLYSRALIIRETVHHKESHPDIADSYNNLASLYMAKGDMKTAQNLFVKAIMIRKKYSVLHPIALGITLRNLALLLHEQGKYMEATRVYRRVIELFRGGLHGDHIYLANIFNDIGYCLFCQKEYAEAENFYIKAYKIQVNRLGASHPELSNILTDIAILLEETDRIRKANKLFQKSLFIRKKAFGIKDEMVGLSYNDLGKNYEKLGILDKAEQCYKIALNILEEKLGTQHPYRNKIRENLSNVTNLLFSNKSS